MSLKLTTSRKYSANTNRINSRSINLVYVQIEYLFAAGGGGGAGGGANVGGGGGGAGGLEANTVNVSRGKEHTITIGEGGSASTSNLQPGGKGSNTVFSSEDITITAQGGGRGIANPADAGALSNGGSGGGLSGATGTPGVGVSGQGSNGSVGTGTYGSTSCQGGGGGGKNGNGSAITGGAGFTSNITGTSVTYSTGGNGGGTTGGSASSVAANRGLGGTGSGGAGGNGSAGGSGVAIIKYSAVDTINAVATGTFTYSELSGYRIFTFTANGTITF